MDINKLAVDIQSEVVGWRRYLHQIPEVGNDLEKTSGYVQDCLREMGIPFVTMVNGSGIVGTITGNSTGKTIALRADMDGLAMEEATTEEFRSTNIGKMHACGHDAHVAMLLGATKILNDHRASINGTVKLIFQPGEEGPGGAALMIEEGCLEGVDAIFGQHIGCLVRGIEESGKITVSHDVAMASGDSFEIKITGKSAHGAYPEDGINPIVIVAQVINGINMMKVCNCPSTTPSVISICMIEGGTAINRIPNEVTLKGSLRSVDSEMRTEMLSKIKQISESISLACGAVRCDFVHKYGYDITKNNPDMADLVIKAAKDLRMDDDIVEQSVPLMGSEDMSFFLNQVPGAYYFLSSIVRQGENGEIFGHHHEKFMLDESVFPKGVALFVQIVANYLA
jgi:amidohydrolase